MLQSEHIRGLPVDVKRNSVLLALYAATPTLWLAAVALVGWGVVEFIIVD